MLSFSKEWKQYSFNSNCGRCIRIGLQYNIIVVSVATGHAEVKVRKLSPK